MSEDPAHYGTAAAPAPEPLGVGLHDGIAPARYHADPCAEPSLSSGIVRTLATRTPAHAYLEHPRLGGGKREATPAMIFGGYVHAQLSGLAQEMDNFAVSPFDDFRAKDARAWRDEQRAAGREILTCAAADTAGRIVAALRERATLGLSANPFDLGQAEVTAIWQEDATWLRARFDRLVEEPGGMCDVWDWKTTSTPLNAHDLTRHIVAHGYHIQAAHYLRGLTTLRPDLRGRVSFVFAFVETVPPYSVRRVVLDPAFLAEGARQVERALAIWRACLASGLWPDDSALGTLSLELPGYLVPEDEIIIGD